MRSGATAAVGSMRSQPLPGSQRKAQLMLFSEDYFAKLVDYPVK